MAPTKIPAHAYYHIKAPQNFCPAMRDDVQLLLSNRAYVSMTTLIMCCIDALAAGEGKAKPSKFQAFVNREFAELCRDLERLVPGYPGAKTLYDEFRNRFVHTRGPRVTFAIAEDHEVDRAWANHVEIEGKDEVYVALNVDRLAREFLSLLERYASGDNHLRFHQKE